MKLTNLLVIAVLAMSAAVAHADGDSYTPKKRRKAAPQPTMAAPAPMASAHQNQAGCGLGSLAIQDNGKWSQVGASILNATGFQSIAISFGTSNCTEDGVTQASREKEAFIEANYADLQHDVASGSGEYLSSLASLYGCQPASFATIAKKSGAFGETNPDAAATRLDGSVKADASCHS